MDIETIKIEDLRENNYNPNEMTDTQKEHLEAEFKRVGYLQPILVRPKDGKWEIIDGANRFLVAKALNHAEIQCVVKEMTDEQAKITSINMNKIKGEDNPVKLAELLKGLKDTFDSKELTELIRMSDQELDSFDLMLDLPENLDEDIESAIEEDGLKYSFKLTPDQNELFTKAREYTQIQNNLVTSIMSIVEGYIYHEENCKN